VEADDGIPAETLRRIGVDLPAFARSGGRAQQAGQDPGRLAVADHASATSSSMPRRGAPSQRRVRLHGAPAPGHSRGRRRGPANPRPQRGEQEAILQALTGIRGSQRVTSPNPESTYQSLEKYGRDLTAEARAGKLDPVIGRDEEIRRVIRSFRAAPRTTRS